MSERFKADAAEMRIRTRLADRVRSHLSKNEQETGISFFGDSNTFKITTYKPAIVRKILRHDYAAVEWVYVHQESGSNRRVGSVEEIDEVPGRPDIEGIAARMPLGTLTVKGSPRKSDKPSKIANTPADAADVREAFNDD